MKGRFWSIPGFLHATVTVILCSATSELRAQPPSNAALCPPMAMRDACRFLRPVACEQPQSTEDEFGLGLPTPDRLFRLESEQDFRDRLRRELPKVKNVQFPKDVPFVPEAKGAEVFPPQRVGPVVAPICYRPLYFEDKRTERFGRYVPYLQPLVSASKFYAGVLLLPYRMVMAPPWTFECDNR